MSACAWCHRYVGGEAERCLFPGSQQCALEMRLEAEAFARNTTFKRNASLENVMLRGDR